MALTLYTSYDDIRAALGVSNEELEDATLSLQLYEFNLIAELEDISLDLPSDFATVAGDTQRDEDSERLYQSVRLFSTYAVSSQLASSLPLFSPKDVTDGKAGFSRYSDSPYKETIKEIKRLFDRYRGRVVNSYASWNASTAPTTTTRTYFAVVSPASDPVTGT